MNIQNNSNKANDVNGTSAFRGVASGRGGGKASQVVIKQNPYNEMKIATWNVRTLAKPGKLENVKKEMHRYGINILGLTEVRWKDIGDINSDEVRMIYSGGREAQRGVAVLLDKQASKAVVETECYNDRLMSIKLSGNPVDIVIIVVYMPTSDHQDEEVEDIYNLIEEKLRTTKGKDYVVVMGDMNSVIGEGKDGSAVGEYGLGVRNVRGEMLVDFCERNNLVATNTWFKNRYSRRYTWKAPGDIRRMQLDYILVKRRYRNSVKNACSYPGADVDSDHNLVMMRVKLKLKKVVRARKVEKWNRDELKGDSRNKFVTLVNQELEKNTEVCEGVEERWQNLKRALITSAEETIGKNKMKRIKKPWITDNMLKKMDERRRWKNVNSEEGKRCYRRLNNELRRETDEAREKWWKHECDEIESLEAMGKSDAVYQKVKELTFSKRSCKKQGGIESSDGKLLTDPADVKNRWTEYVEILYDKDGKPTELPIEAENEIEEDERGPSILREEIITAMNGLKEGKAEGTDNIPAEMIKVLEGKALDDMIALCQEIYQTGNWPKEFLESIMVPLEKKTGTKKCEEHRTISLISHASKVVLKVLAKRLVSKVDNIIGNDQFGFVKGRGTREAIAVMRILGERNVEFNRDLFVCFVDFEKAFDRVNWVKLLDILKNAGIDWRDRRLIANLYMGQTARVRTNEGESDPGVIGRGVRQGCLLSPALFNMYAEAMIREALEETDEGVKVGGHMVKAVRFADDQAMITDTEQGLQNIMNRLNMLVEDFGMRINVKKTKVMRIGKSGIRNVNIMLNGKVVERVKSFKYLGSMLTEDGFCEKEIQCRIALAKVAFNKHRILLTKNLNIGIKKRLIKTLVWSVLLYGSEAWTLKKTDIRRLESAEMWFWRRMERISWTERITNEEVLRRVGENRSLIETIYNRQKKWLGHTLRHDSLLRDVIEGRMEGKRSKGRKRKTLFDYWRGDNETYGDIKRRSEDRQRWRRN